MPPNNQAKGIFSDRDERAIAAALSALAAAVTANTEQRKIEFEWFKSTHGLPTKQDLKETKDAIMSKISEYSEAVNARFDELDANNEEANAKLVNIVDDLTYLKGIIEQLNNNPGPITPEDQALLDAGLQRATASVTRAQALKEALAAADAATERPTPPPA